ncbi:hypothetical protein ABEV54_05860 [Peribacillus psychrosaccharolyticus]|uniref:hypothetical protein n=1 Tax=Peribacillus psychrosaccharolyticus TaxID=1407 RepID=UPI003D27AD89
MDNIRKITKGIVATTLSLGLLLTATTPADAVIKWKRVDYGADMLKKVQKDTAKMNQKQKLAYSDKVIENIAKEAKKQKTTVGKIKFIHDRVAERITYDDSKKFNVESITEIGTLTNGKGKSQGYALVFNTILSKVGINNTVMADDDGYCINLVKISGKTYSIDLTANDLGDDRVPSYEDFLISKDKNSKYRAFSEVGNNQASTNFNSDSTGIYAYTTKGIQGVKLSGEKKRYQTFSQGTSQGTFVITETKTDLWIYTFAEKGENSKGETVGEFNLYRTPYNNLKKRYKVLSSPKSISFVVDTVGGKLDVEYNEGNKRTNKTIKFKAY